MNLVSTSGRAQTLRTDRIEARANGLLGDCRRAFHAFGDLDELAENLRILSLNAELAAGRAGDKGRAVRALTQYTRELVNRLAQIQGEMNTLRGHTFALSSTILRGMSQLALFERACELINDGQHDSRACSMADRAFNDIMRMLVDTLDSMAGAVKDLARRTHGVEEVVSQSDSIATNIAIEAAAAGVHEKEFRTVSDTMRRYVDDLRTMIDEASDAVRRASEKGDALRRLGLDSLDDSEFNG
ncbi:chemotaxis protein [Paramagnetospirillum kuznetsovii]|uniref:Chemotaxis protein n=1 Tax=Paramagnetospirillum kuznetsovii TaxID=2053833 RepID=A0A364P3E0_9PROT|nr:chemotaxis protein [Paramagnetospirillum kuznetsovii]RAU23811.1 chemotaxis protein [Paramagnetospirillum kuznetsovii]